MGEDESKKDKLYAGAIICFLVVFIAAIFSEGCTTHFYKDSEKEFSSSSLLMERSGVELDLVKGTASIGKSNPKDELFKAIVEKY